ncbi:MULTISPECIES: hypothetical protein [unclassified Streptosporangium]|uniref:hypothetical protein n=1 Tax=unclassified Streptosporangium TaxID=2632669 RepID=UPI002E2B9FDA|nr:MULTISPECIES: hypothetical protein [unclassified Streptosporangium]
MSDVLAGDDAGDALVAFHRVTEETRFDDAPLPLTLVALWHGDRTRSNAGRRAGPAGEGPDGRSTRSLRQ